MSIITPKTKYTESTPGIPMDSKPKLPLVSDPKAIPPFAALRAFEVVGRRGGIRRASAALGLNHSVVSRHLTMPEPWIGVPLFNRERNTWELTKAGEQYHRRISAAIAGLAEATFEIMQPENASLIKVWSSNGFAALWLGKQLVEFSTANLEIEIELHSSDAPPNLFHHEADVDIRYFADDEETQKGGKGLKYCDLG